MEAARTAMVDTQVRPNDVTDRALIRALLHTPREAFLPKELEPVAYSEKALQTSPGRWLWEPRDFGKLIEEAEVEAGHKVLNIAAGSGYTAAVLAAMGAQVTALEDDAGLHEALKARFAGAANIEVAKGSLADAGGLKGPFDVVIVGGAVEVVPEAWLAVLGDGGRLAVAVRENGVGRARIYVKSNGVASYRSPFDCTPPVLAGFEAPEGFRF